MIKVSFNYMTLIRKNESVQKMGLNLYASTILYYINYEFPWNLAQDKKRSVLPWIYKY